MSVGDGFVGGGVGSGRCCGVFCLGVTVVGRTRFYRVSEIKKCMIVFSFIFLKIVYFKLNLGVELIFSYLSVRYKFVS